MKIGGMIILLFLRIQNGYSCQCLVDYRLLFPADLILKENDALVFEGQVVDLKYDTIRHYGYTTFHAIAHFKILSLYKGQYESDTIPVHYYNDGSTCDIGFPRVGDKYLIAEFRDENTNELVIGFCSFSQWFHDDYLSREMAKRSKVDYNQFLKYFNKQYFEMKSIFEQLTSFEQDGPFKIYIKHNKKQQLVVEGIALNGTLKSAKIYDEDGELAFEILK